MSKKKKKKKSGIPDVHKDLEGLDFKINELGEIGNTIDVNKINEFLNKNIKDKKLVEKTKKESKAKSRKHNNPKAK